MIHAYDKIYLSDAKKLMAHMFDFAMFSNNIDPDLFAKLFTESKYAKMIERGNPSVLSGKSGVEVGIDILETYLPDSSINPVSFKLEKSAYYWAGWSLAHYQWYTAKRFSDIFKRIKLSEILDMYFIYHEMDITNFIDDLNKKYDSVILPTNLKVIRENNGLSQSELSKKSGINIRSLQMFEQRVNDIDKCQCQTLYKLALALDCNIEDLLERPEL